MLRTSLSNSKSESAQAAKAEQQEAVKVQQGLDDFALLESRSLKLGV
jgi:hypothetical protein